MKDRDVERARALLADMSRKWEQLPFLSNDPGMVYAVPESGPVQLEYRGLLLDEIEDMLPKSAAWRQASRIVFAPPRQINGRPLTPLHAGHVALCAVGGMLDGIFGSGEDRHVAAWSSVKENVINYARWVGWLPTLSGDPSLSPLVRSCVRGLVLSAQLGR